MEIRTITIPGQPVGKSRPRFTRNGRTYTPKKTADYEKLVAQIYTGKYGNTADYEGTVKIFICAYFKIAKSDSKAVKESKEKRRILPTIAPDIDNLCKSIMDGLNRVAYRDDKQVVALVAYKYYSVEPCVVVNLGFDE